MRFHNLTITITLACLSIVAIVALALLPITDAIGNWSMSGDGYSGSYYAQEDQINDSWQLTGSMNAKGVGASGGVSILTHDFYYDNSGPWHGTAKLSALRNSFTWYHGYWLDPGIILCNNRQYVLGPCQGHDELPLADSNVQGNEGFNGSHPNITLTPVVAITKYKIASGYSKKKKMTVSGKVGADYGPINSESTFIYEGETIKTTSLSAERQRKEVTNDAHTSSHSVSVAFDERASSSASASVSFKGASGSEAVSYSP